jgi:hypothetical protein
MSDQVSWVDRSKWGRGPWDAEPEDKVEFRHADLPCLLVRGPAGAWCGYVGVPPDHPLHGKRATYEAECPVGNLSVHGGITYEAPCQVGGHICHVPAPGEPDDVWWLGFDCNHSGDVAPKYEGFDSRLGKPTGWGSLHEYRTRDYARRQTEQLAEQLARPGA